MSLPTLPINPVACPHWFDIRTDYVANSFNSTKYQGYWYELAHQDVTQPIICGCTTFDWRKLPDSSRVEEPTLDVLDVFTLHCPKFENQSGRQYPTNLTTEVFDSFPGWFIESWGEPGKPNENCNGAGGPIAELPFCQRDNTFANMVVDLGVYLDENGEEQYDTSIQFQCQENFETGEIEFTALNFMSRTPNLSRERLEAMYETAIGFGLGEYMYDWGNGLHEVDHSGCDYPDNDGFFEDWSENGRYVLCPGRTLNNCISNCPTSPEEEYQQCIERCAELC